MWKSVFFCKNLQFCKNLKFLWIELLVKQNVNVHHIQTNLIFFFIEPEQQRPPTPPDYSDDNDGIDAIRICCVSFWWKCIDGFRSITRIHLQYWMAFVSDRITKIYRTNAMLCTGTILFWWCANGFITYDFQTGNFPMTTQTNKFWNDVLTAFWCCFRLWMLDTHILWCYEAQVKHPFVFTITEYEKKQCICF